MVNTAANDGCPILSPYDNSLYIASNRPGSVPNSAGGNSLDIWIAPWTGNGWGTPVNAGQARLVDDDVDRPDPATQSRPRARRQAAQRDGTDGAAATSKG